MTKFLRRAAGSLLKSYYKPDRFYPIPFGPNKGRRISYHRNQVMDIMLGLHEPNSFEFFKQVLEPGMVVLDVGVNVGYFTIFFSAQVGPCGKVIAFEPMPETFRTLVETCKMNGCGNVDLRPTAVSNKSGPTNFYCAQHHLMSSLDQKWVGNGSRSIALQGESIDQLFEQEMNDIKRVDLIKMDIEGGGVYALPGMSATIRKFQPSLFLESHTPEEDQAIGDALQLADYEVYRVGSAIPVTHLDRDHRDKEGVYGTLVGVPRNNTCLLSRLRPDSFQKWRFGQRS